MSIRNGLNYNNVVVYSEFCSNMLVNKPDEWVRIALQRFQVQLPHERTPEHNESKESIEKIQETLITLSEQRFPLVMQGLSKLIKEPAFINSFPSNKKDKIGESNVIVLSTIEKCLCKYPEQCSRLEDDVLSNLLPSIIQYVLQTFDFPHAPEIQKLAAKIVSHISSFHFSAIFNKVSFRLHQLSSVDDGNNDVNYLTLIRYLKLTSSSLMILLEECLDTFKSLKKSAKLALISSLEKAIWNWIKHDAEEFAKFQRSPSKKLSELCDNLFEILVSFAESTKRKAAVWPLQIMLLMLSPDTLTAIASGEKQQDAHLEVKREFLESLKTALTSAKALTESSAIAWIKLCKCATYVKPADNSVLCFLVVTVMNELKIIHQAELQVRLKPGLKALLFNFCKPFMIVSQSTIPIETLMVDCFVSSFRINYRNSQPFADCLLPTAPVIFSVVYVKGLYTIVRQRGPANMYITLLQTIHYDMLIRKFSIWLREKPLHWWPTLKVMYSKAESVRNLFERTLEKFRVLENSHGASRMSVLYKGKEKRSKEEEVGTLKAEKELLLWLVRLFRMEPAFAFSNTQKTSLKVHQNSQKLLLGLVHLILSSHFGKDVSQEASQTLLILHSPENVQLWNPSEPIYSFWEISSECVHLIGDSLVNHGAKDLWLLKYMKKLMACRNEFIEQNKDDPNFSCNSLVSSSARVKLEEVFLQYLWNPDADAILTALSCLKFLCTEINIISHHSMDNIAQLNLMTSIFTVYEELANLANGISTGRLALQKRIMAILRNVKVQTSGNKHAWDSTYSRWRKLTHALINFPKEEIPGEPAQSSKSIRRRTTRFSQSGKISAESIEGYINEWNYMTGFLCSLGAVCFKEHPQLSRRISRSRSGIGKLARLPSISQPEEAETVKGFVGELLRLSVCTNEHVGTKIRLIIKDLIGQELSSALYSTLFKEIRRDLEGFFTSGGQAIVQDMNSCFVDQVIAIMKHILENKNGVPVECFKMEIIEPIIISIIRYTRNLPFTSRSLIIKSRIGQLVVTLMSHRDEVLFFQEIKFRNKLVEYLSDWVAHASNEESELSYEITVNSRYLDECAMKAIAQLLSALPLQPEATDVDIMEAKSELFLKYFTLFLNLLSRCVGPEEDGNDGIMEKKRQKSVVTYHDNLHQCTVAAMSNLLSANIDAGLTHAIGLGYHADLATRAIFMEVLMKILNQGTEFDTLAETATRDRYEQLANLMATMGEKGELLLAVALANVVPSNEQDDLAQVLVTLFDAVNLLYQFLWNILSQEVRNCEGFHVLFRGNTLATKVTTFCFKIYGSNYIHYLLGPLIRPLLKQENLNTTFELDPSRLEEGENLEENTQNVINLAEKFLNHFFASLDDFPNALKLLCYCLKKVVSQRFRQHKAEAVGNAIFLRFINPAINSPQMLGIVEHPPPENIRRGLMFLSKILQSLANNVLFTKEKHMEPLNGFLKENLTKTQQYFEKISLQRPSLKGENRDVYSFVSDANILSLHRMLWNSQEKIGLYMAARGEFKIYGRGIFEKLTTLLARLGPPDPQRLQVQKKWSTQGGSSDFEEVMARHADSGDRDLEEIRNLKIFYQEGRSKNGNPVFYFIPRRLRGDVISAERLIYHVLLTLKSSFGQAWELVCDVTQTATSNQMKLMSLTKCISVLPVSTINNLQAVYVYNMTSALKGFIKINERFFSHFKHHSQVIVIDNLSKFNDYIAPEELKLPSTTTSLEKDLNVFSAIKVHYRVSVLIKIGTNCIQIQTSEKHKILGYSFHIKDIFFPNEIEDVFSQNPDDNLFGLKFKTSASVLYMSNESDQIVQAVTHLKKRWLMSQPNQTAATKKILPKDVPGTLLNMALLNLGTRDPSLRLAAYNLLCALTTVFHFKIEERLFEGTGLCIPANNTIFIVGISSSLANKEPHLTLEFLQECITGFKKSNHELKHLCLEYMAPWLANLSRYCKEPSKGAKRAQVNAILEDLIELTIAEKGAMYPSIQAKIWGNMGKVTELVDTVLDSFIKASTAGGLGSVKAEVMADTSVALATANVQVVSSKFINRLLMLIRKTSITPKPRLEEHLMWEDIAILNRYLLMLSFNDSLDVANNLPHLFHIIISLVCMGPLFLRATIHGILINVIQSISTCTSLELPDETKRLLRLRMSEFSLPKFYLLFGISQVKSAPVRAFQSSYHGGRHVINLRDSEKIHMTSIQTIANFLLEVVEACMKDIPDCTWLDTWIKLAMEFAFKHNPPLQARAVIVYGCICKEIDDAQIRQLLLVFIKALNDFSDVSLIEGVIMCFTKLLTILDKKSRFHTASFWIAIGTLQLAESGLYPAGLTLLEQSLLTLESQGVFDKESVDEVLLNFRKDPRMEWHCKQLDHIIGVSFASNFHFALVAYLLKGLRHGSSSTNTRAIRILNLMLNIAGKHKTNHMREKFAVYKETIPYLAALLIVSDEIRTKLRPNSSLHARPKSIPESQSSITPPSSMPVSPVTITIESPVSPGPAQISGVETEVFLWPAEVENRLLDPGVVNDTQTQALLLTTLSTLVRHTKDDLLEKFLFEVLAEASLVFPKVFPVIYSLISSKLAMVLGHSQDVGCLQAVQTIMQSTISLNFAEKQLGTNFLQGFGFDGFSQFAGPFYDQGELQYETRAQIFVRFAEGVLESCGGVMDDSLRASCVSLAKPAPEKVEHRPLRLKISHSSSLTSIPDDPALRDNDISTQMMKRSLSSRRKSGKERKEKDRSRSKRSLTQRVVERELKKALTHRNSDV